MVLLVVDAQELITTDKLYMAVRRCTGLRAA